MFSFFSEWVWGGSKISKELRRFYLSKLNVQSFTSKFTLDIDITTKNKKNDSSSKNRNEILTKHKLYIKQDSYATEKNTRLFIKYLPHFNEEKKYAFR